jgi:uncharacterized membrane protein YfcA
MDFSIQAILVLGATSFISSVIGAISGIGGGIIIKPVMDLVSPFGIETNNFLAGSTVFAMACVSLFTRRSEWVNCKNTRWGTALALGSAIGGIAEKKIFSSVLVSIGDSTGLIQSLMIILLTIFVLIYMVNKKNIKPREASSRLLGCLLGLVLGLLSSFLGIGGGPINIMVISYFFNADIKTTGIYSLYTICLSQLSSISLSFITGKMPVIPIEILIIMITGGITGGLLGTRIVSSLKKEQVNSFFCIVLVLVILVSSYNIIKIYYIFL